MFPQSFFFLKPPHSSRFTSPTNTAAFLFRPSSRSFVFAICGRLFQARDMTQPLALVLYEKLLPGSQLVNRLQDAGYRVQTVPAADALVASAEQEKTIIVLTD